jgi:hypothetical protein
MENKNTKVPKSAKSRFSDLTPGKDARGGRIPERPLPTTRPRPNPAPRPGVAGGIGVIEAARC